MGGSRGGQGVRTPSGKLQKYRVFSNTGPDPLEITKLPSQQSMTGHHRPANETPFKWYLDPLPTLSTKIKTFSELSWTPSDKTFWVQA